MTVYHINAELQRKYRDPMARRLTPESRNGKFPGEYSRHSGIESLAQRRSATGRVVQRQSDVNDVVRRHTAHAIHRCGVQRVPKPRQNTQMRVFNDLHEVSLVCPQKLQIKHYQSCCYICSISFFISLSCMV